MPPFWEDGASRYANQLKQLDEELEELCRAFHADASHACGRAALFLYAIAEAKQLSVTSILTQILNDKVASLPFLLTQEHLPRPQGPQIELLDRSAEFLSMAARLANKPFKQALRKMLTELNMPIERGESGEGRLIMRPVKRLAEIAEEYKRDAAMNIFDLNQATIVFESEAELRLILESLPRYFEVVCLENKFRKQWEQATQPPCLRLNLRIRPELLPVELTSMLAGWVVELQLSMRDLLHVKQRCHAIYEILRLRVAESGEGEHKAITNDSTTVVTQYRMLPLPRACPKCGLLQHYVKSSQLRHIVDVSVGKKLVKKCLLTTDISLTSGSGETEQKDEREVAYNVVALGEGCRSHEDVFLREMSVLARLNHPNLLPILGIVCEPGSLGFVTEWMPQCSLWRCLQDLQESQQLDVWAVAFQLCEALIYVHSYGVIHFNLKSKNVLVARQIMDGSPSLVVKLDDFTLSRQFDGSMLVSGTPNWQAPETWGDVNSFHPSADVYGFGGVLIELFGKEAKPGCFPWMQERSDRKRIKKQVKQHRAKPPELEFVVEPKVRLLAADCLAFDPESRPSMKKVKARLLAAHLESLSFDPGARRILVAMEVGTLDFSNLFAKLQSTTSWPATVSFLKKYWKVSPGFEVALAMCYFFDNKNHNDSVQALAQRNEKEESLEKTKRVTTKELTLVDVCERHIDEVLAAKFMAGWCSAHGTGGGSRDEERAMRYYRQAAAQGYPAAQFQLGLFHRRQHWSQKQNVDDLQETVRWFIRAANQGHIGAQLSLARCYQLGEGVNIDLRYSQNLLQRAAIHAQQHDTTQETEKKQAEKRGSAIDELSMQYLWGGECFKNGREVERDDTEAARLYSLAAERGNSQAQFNLGVCFANGEGVPQDDSEAARLYRLAAYQGDADAQSNPCRVVSTRDTEVARLHRHQGHAEAQFYLGVCFANGRGVQRDDSEAARLFRLAADRGHAVAQYALGLCFANGRGVQREESEAVRLYRLAADQGHADAQFNLGVWTNGRDNTEAARLFRLAADQGHVKAQNQLGLCFQLEGDNTEAARLFRLAADQGHADAQFNLGMCFANGEGVPHDDNEAARLYRLAANQGHADAQFNLGVCIANGRGVQQDDSEAARLYRLAADQGHGEAQFYLGVCFAHGKGSRTLEAVSNPPQGAQLIKELELEEANKRSAPSSMINVPVKIESPKLSKAGEAGKGPLEPKRDSSTILLGDVVSLVTAESLKSFPEFLGLEVLKELYDMEQAPTDWPGLRNRIVLGPVPAWDPISMHLANQYFKRNQDKRYVGFLNCGRGRVRYQLYEKDPNNHKIALLEDRPGNKEEGAELDKLQCGSYQPEVAVEAEILKGQLEDETKGAPWARLEKPIDVYGFVAGQIRDEAEFRVLRQALAELFPQSVQPVTALLGPSPFGLRSYSLSPQDEGKCLIEGALTAYQQMKNVPESKETTTRLVPIASLKIGPDTAHWAQPGAEPFTFLGGSVSPAAVGLGIAKCYRRNPEQFQALCEMIRVSKDCVPTIALQPGCTPHFLLECQAVLGTPIDSRVSEQVNVTYHVDTGQSSEDLRQMETAMELHGSASMKMRKLELPRIAEKDLTIEEVIGEGTVSVVRKAKWNLLVSNQSMSIIVAAKSNRVSVPIEVARDLKVISSLPHQNIVTLYGVCESPNGEILEIVYELMSTDLAKMLKTEKQLQSQPSPSRQVLTPVLLRVLRDVAAGLAHLHEHGVIHRDVKPSHVLLRDEQVKLCGFGLNMDLQHTAQKMAISSTLNYMAPEVFNKQPVGRASDVWSFGVLLFECMTGRVCERTASTSDLRDELKQMGCLSTLTQLFAECHEFEPSKRPSMSHIHDQLQRLVLQEASNSQRLQEEFKWAEAQDRDIYESTWKRRYDNQELLGYVEDLCVQFSQVVRQPLKHYEGKGSMGELGNLASDSICARLHYNLGAIVEECGGTYVPGSRMSHERCVRKVQQEYSGDYSKLLDLESANGLFERAEDMLRCLQRVRGHPSLTSRQPVSLVHCKDRLNRPLKIGYRDVLLNVRDEESGFVAELQLHFPEIAQIKSHAHQLYEVSRLQKYLETQDKKR